MASPYLGDVTISGGLTVASNTVLNGTASTRNVTVRSGSLLLLDAAASTVGTPEVDSAIARFNTTYWNGTQNTLGTIDVYGTTDTSGPYLRVHGSVYGDAEVAGFTLRSQTTVLGTSGVYDGATVTAANRVYSLANKVPVAGISATGSPGSTTYLRGDGTWTAATATGGQAGEVATSTGPASAFGVTGTAQTVATVSWSSIAGHRYRVTAYTCGDTDATVSGAIDVRLVVGGVTFDHYPIYANAAQSTANTFYYGTAISELGETATQTRTASVTGLRTGGTFTFRANQTQLIVEDVTSGSSLIVAPSSNAPAQNVVVGQARATADLPLNTTATVVPGCSYTLPVSGTYLVTFMADFSWAPSDGALIAYMRLDGVPPTINPQAVLSPQQTGTLTLRVDCANTTVITGTAGQVLTLVANKLGGSGASLVNTGHSGFTVTLPGTGNLDSDSLNLMGAF